MINEPTRAIEIIKEKPTQIIPVPEVAVGKAQVNHILHIDLPKAVIWEAADWYDKLYAEMVPPCPDTTYVPWNLYDDDTYKAVEKDVKWFGSHTVLGR